MYRDTIDAKHRRRRAELARHIEEYKRRGGRIQELEPCAMKQPQKPSEETPEDLRSRQTFSLGPQNH